MTGFYMMATSALNELTLLLKPELVVGYVVIIALLSLLSANPTKWSKKPDCLSVFDHFTGLALKELTQT